VAMTLAAIGIAYLAQRWMTRGERKGGRAGGMGQAMGGLEM